MITTTAPGVLAPPDVVRRTLRAMAGPVTLAVVGPAPTAEAQLDRAEAVVRDVERTCSRFDPASALSRANAEPDRWHTVPRTLARAVREAARAHRSTGGLFDPRVHDVLVGWGYDRTLPFADGTVERDVDRTTPPAAPPPAPPEPAAWRPEVTRAGDVWRLHLRGSRIDLGGIGKGLAVRWASAELAGAGDGHLVDAGGDCAFAGRSPQGGSWRIGVEDPRGGPGPLLVLELTDGACATSSTRLRHWRAGGSDVHHLVDPRTHRPGGDGLAAVTVAGEDPAWAEVMAKTLFLSGATAIAGRAADLGLAAAWVATDGSIGVTPVLRSRVIWRHDDV